MGPSIQGARTSCYPQHRPSLPLLGGHVTAFLFKSSRVQVIAGGAALREGGRGSTTKQNVKSNFICADRCAGCCCHCGADVGFAVCSGLTASAQVDGGSSCLCQGKREGVRGGNAAERRWLLLCAQTCVAAVRRGGDPAVRLHQTPPCRPHTHTQRSPPPPPALPPPHRRLTALLLRYAHAVRSWLITTQPTLQLRE